MGGVRTGRFRFILSFLPYEVVEGAYERCMR